MPVWVGYVWGGLQLVGAIVCFVIGQQAAGVALMASGLGQLGVHKYTP